MWVGPMCSAVTLDKATGAVTGTRAVGSTEAFSQWCGAGDALVVGRRLVVSFSQLGGYVCGYNQGAPIPQAVVTRGIVTFDYGPEPVADAMAANISNLGCGTFPPNPPETPLSTAVSTGAEILWPSHVLDRSFLVSPVDCANPCPAEGIAGFDIGNPASALATKSGDWVVVDPSSGVTVRDGTSREVEWTGSLASVVHLAATASTIYAATSTGTVAAFPAAGCGAAMCEPTWTATTGGSAHLSVGGAVLYAGDADGLVSALPANGCGAAICAPLWSFDVGDGVVGRPVIDGGTLLVVSFNGLAGTVTAFRLPD